MLRSWAELLPVFIIRRVAQYCECFDLHGIAYYRPRPGVYVAIPESGFAYRVDVVEKAILRDGLEYAEAQWRHFGKRVFDQALRKVAGRFPEH